MKLFTAYLTLVSFLFFEATPLVALQTVKPTASSPAAQTKRPTQTTGDGGWPRGYTTASGARVILYQPQVESWPDQKRMTLFAAVSYEPSGATKPALGTIKIESDTRVALAERLVSFSEFTIAESHFPTLEKDAVKTAVDEIKDAVPRAERVIALDRVLASVDTSQITPKNVNGVRSDPPLVYVSQRPAVLVNLDGDPIWSPIAQNDLKFAVNTNWDVFQDPATSHLYLRVEKSWLSAPSIKGPWTAANTLPASFAALPADGNWDEVKAALPAKPATGHLPVVLVSTTPAELILFDGVPKPVPVKGTDLVWLSNTESDVFRQGASGRPLLSRVRPVVLVAGTRRTVDLHHAEPSGRLRPDPAGSSAVAHPRIGAGHASGARSGAARSDPADRAREPQGGSGAGRRVSG
jgi:hypothetical protein